MRFPARGAQEGRGGGDAGLADAALPRVEEDPGHAAILRSPAAGAASAPAVAHPPSRCDDRGLMLDVAIDVVLVLAGIVVVAWILWDVYQTVVVPRPTPTRIRLAKYVTRVMWRTWRWRAGRASTPDASAAHARWLRATRGGEPALLLDRLPDPRLRPDPLRPALGDGATSRTSAPPCTRPASACSPSATATWWRPAS